MECFDLSSDHSPVILTLNERMIEKESNLTLTNRSTDWDKFRIDLSKNIQLNVPLKTKVHLDCETERLIIDIQQVAWENTIITNKKIVANNYPQGIRELVKEKRKARKKWQQTRTPVDKNKLNKLTQQLRRKIQEIKNMSINSYLRALIAGKDTEYSLWRVTTKIKRPITQIPPIRRQDGTWARTNKSRVGLLADHLEKTF